MFQRFICNTDQINLYFCAMHLRKQISLFLALLIFVANIGLHFSVHYCKDTIASISFQFKTDEPCLEKVASCCAKVASHDSCCSNKIVKVEKKTDDILVKTVQLVFQPAVLYSESKPNSIGFESGISASNRDGYYCHSHGPPLYKLNCQFVFYA